MTQFSFSLPLALTFANPAGLWLASAALPVIVLFLLKRRRKDLRIGSTMLWEAALKDLVARSPFRRPSEWLSLFLLLATIFSLALSAAGVRLGGQAGGRTLVVVIDLSASMTTEHPQGSRLEQAVEGARRAVRGMRKGDTATIIAAGRQARIASHASTDRAALESILNGLEARAEGCDLRQALELALSEARGAQAGGGLDARVLVFSDFACGAARLSEVETAGIALTLVPCGTPVTNVGIVHAALASGPLSSHLLVTVAANTVGPAARSLSLFEGGELVDVHELEFAASGKASVVFTVHAREPDASTTYELRLEPGDAMAMDDVAYVALDQVPPPSMVHVGESDPFLERLPFVFSGLEFECVSPAELTAWSRGRARPVDLAIFTEAVEAGSEPGAHVSFYLGCIPELSGLAIDGELVQPLVLDWERRSPWLRDVGLENLQLLSSLRLVLPPLARPLVRTTAGVQLVELEGETGPVLIWASGMHDSNLALIPGFPILIQNLLGAHLGGTSASIQRASKALSVRAGMGRWTGTVELSVTSPTGDLRSQTLWAREDFVWQGPLEPGFYTLRAEEQDGTGGALLRSVAVSLLSKQESTSPIEMPTPEKMRGENVSVERVERLESEVPAWHWFVLAGLLLLVAEAFVWARSWRV